MVIYKDGNYNGVPMAYNLFAFICVFTAWAACGVLTDYTGEEESIAFVLFVILLFGGGLLLFIDLIAYLVCFIRSGFRKKYIFDDSCFRIKNAFVDNRYDYMLIKDAYFDDYHNLNFTFNYEHKLVYIPDYQTAINVVTELAKHVEIGRAR